MRVIVVDYDLELLERTARALRDDFVLDVTSSAADASDLLRHNKFDLVVAGEHLADGSGLDLLAQIARRWPDTLRVLAVEPARIDAVSRLAEKCALFESVAYPIDPEELHSILLVAQGALGGDTSDPRFEHVVLEVPPPTVKGTRPLPDADSPESQLLAAAGFVAVRAPAAKRRQPVDGDATDARGDSHGVPASLLPSLPAGETNSARTPTAARAPGLLDAATKPWAFAVAITVCVVLLIVLALRWSPGGNAQAGAANGSPEARTAQIVERIEMSLVRDDYQQAKQAVAELRDLDPKHPRLEFFDTMLKRADAARQAAAASPRRRPSVAPEAPAESGGAALPPPQATRPAAAELTVKPSAAVLASAALPAPGAAPAASSEPRPPAAGSAAPPGGATPPTVAGAPSAGAAAPPVQATSAAGAPAEPAPPKRRVIRDLADLPPVVREHRLIGGATPEYPLSAVRDRIEGAVDVAFTITRDGRVRDVQVLQSDPAKVFDRAAVDAVKRWRFEPRIEDGVAVDYRTRTRLRFRLQD